MSNHSWYVIDLILALLSALCFAVGAFTERSMVRLAELGLLFYVVISVIAYWRLA